MGFGGQDQQSLAANTTEHESPQIRQLSASELKALIDSGTPLELVDVRTEEECAIAKIDGSRLLDQAYHDALIRLGIRRSYSNATTAFVANMRQSTSNARDFVISTTCVAESTPGQDSSMPPCRGTSLGHSPSAARPFRSPHVVIRYHNV